MANPLYAFTTYTYDARTSLGELPDSGARAMIHGFDNPAAHQFSMSITHENYLPCVVVDGVSRIKIHRRTETFESLESYIIGLRNDGISPVMRYEPTVDLDDDDDPPEFPEFYYVPSQFRKIVRGIVRFVVYLHSVGKSFDGSLSMQEHFVVEESTVKYCKVGFRDALPETMRDDFTSVAKVIEDLFQDDWPLLPSDMRDFIDVINGCCDRLPPRNVEECLLEHLALLSSHKRTKRVSFYSEMAFRVGDDLRDDYNTALRKAKHTSTGWTSTFIKSHRYWPATESFYHPVLAKNPGKTVDDLTDADISGHYADRPTDKQRASGYLRFGRNMDAHLADNYKQCYKTAAEDVDIDCIMMYTLGKFLLEFHGYLSHRLIEFIAERSA